MNYQYKVYRNLTTREVIQKFEPYTFPSFQQKSKVRNLKEPFFAVEAVNNNNETVGIAVLELLYTQPYSVLKVLSLWVQENHRRRGIASNILRIAEKIALNNKINYLNIIFQNNWESFKWMPNLLQKLGWNKPDKRTIIVKASYQQVKNLAWFQIKDFPENFYTTLWVDLPQENKLFIKQKKESQNWYPDALSPFQMPERIVKESSLVLWYKKEIVGWLILHQANTTEKNLVQFTSYFIDKDYRKTKASIALLVQAIENLYQNGITEEAIYIFSADNQEMMSLSKKLVGEYNTGAFTEVWVGQKWIQD